MIYNGYSPPLARSSSFHFSPAHIHSFQQKNYSYVGGNHLSLLPKLCSIGTGIATSSFNNDGILKNSRSSFEHKQLNTYRDLPSDSPQPSLSQKKEDFPILAVLIGWLGASNKSIRKYAKMYENLGIPSVCFIPPRSSLIFPYFAEKTAIDLLHILNKRLDIKNYRNFHFVSSSGFQENVVQMQTSAKSEDLESDRRFQKYLDVTPNKFRSPYLLFHVFSGNGMNIYAHLLWKMSNEIEKLAKKIIINNRFESQFACHGDTLNLPRKRLSTLNNICGLIVDSAPPSSIHPKNLTRAFTASLTGSETSHWLYTPLGYLFFGILLKLPFMKNNFRDLFERFMMSQPYCPQLFLYSENDKIIAVDEIEQFIDHQLKLGRQVYSQRFTDSSHVSHFRNYPDVYENEIIEFLKVIRIYAAQKIQNCNDY